MTLSQPLRVLCITSSYPRYSSDISGRFVLDFCNHLAERGHVVNVLTWSDAAVDPEYAPISHTVERVRYAPGGLDTLFYGAGAPENLETAPLKAIMIPPAMAAMAARLVKKIRARRHQYDVIVGHWVLPGGILARLCGKMLGIPSVVIGHSGGIHMLAKFPRPIARQLARIIVDGPITIPTPELRDKLSQYADASHARILSMGFDPPNITEEIDPTTTIRSERLDWLCMGRHVPIKGFDLAIDAFLAARLRDGSSLHIAGDGPQRNYLEARARARPEIQFHGIITGDHKYNIINRCGYFLLPSRALSNGRHEGLPVSFLEASSLGLITLCGHVPGIEAYLPDPDLQRLTSNEPEHWTAAIKKLAKISPKQRQRLSEETRQKIAHLAWPTLIQQWEDVLFNH